MNGKPVWSRPARTKEYDFGSTVDARDEGAVLLSEAAALVAEALKKGLIRKPAADEPGELGSKSTWAKCNGCGDTFSRHIASIQPLCSVCRLPSVSCKACGIQFQPKQHRQICCSNDCRATIVRAAAQGKKVARVTIICAACRKPFQQTPGNKRKNCSQACGVQSMIAKKHK